LAMDYSNIELRIFAYKSGDKDLIAAFEAGQSVHLVIASVLWPKLYKQLGPDKFKKRPEYGWTKNGNFSLIYGASPRKADATYHQKGAYNLIRNRFTDIDGFMVSKDQEAKRFGYITTMGGYHLQVPQDKPHVAVNYYVQGSAGYYMLLAMPRIHKYLQAQDDCHLILQVHDEFVYDIPNHGYEEHATVLAQTMEQSGHDLGIHVPVETDLIKDTWGDKIALAV
jgi:DNA polymerase I